VLQIFKADIMIPLNAAKCSQRGTVMKKLSTQVGVFVILIIIFAFNGVAQQAELIEPSRSLEAASGAPGHLTVFSEPPGQDVALDDALIGLTPIRIESLDPGIHRLQVGESITKIYIESGKTFHISLFKNRFIKFENTQKEATAPSDNGGQLGVNQRELDRLPQKSPPIEEVNRKAWKRWMQFVNGTSSHF
jgi:hypothetical protein